MNPTIDNDLQKAIDDITKNTNSDPVFGDAIAAPVAPAKPQSKSAPHRIASMPPVAKPSRPAPSPARVATPASPARMPMPPAPRPKAASHRPAPTPAPIAPAPMPPAPVEEEFMATAEEEYIGAPTDMRGVKEAALRDLAPIMNKIDVDPSRKFNLYRDIHDKLHDNSVIAPAYETARAIQDDSARADALLYLIDTIDGLNQ